MKLLDGIADRIGGDRDGLSLVGRVEMAFVERRDHYSNRKVDAYRPRPVRLALARDGRTVAEIAPGSPEFEEVSKTLDRIHRMPLFEMLAEEGGPAPHEGEDFALPYAEIADLARAEDMLFASILGNDEAAGVESGWIRFRHSRAFKDAPCTREEFVVIRAEFLESPFLTGMDLGDYYAWWRRSESNMDGDGFAEGTRATAARMLEAWRNDRDPKSLRYWMSRNLEVHPRHRHVVDRIVEAHLAGEDPFEPATVAPGP